MATIVAASGAAGNWSVGSAWVGGVAPTASDDAQITSTTTSITIDATAVCRSADFTGFTGTLTMGATGALGIGTTTAGLSNIALKMPSGFTFAPNSGATFNFISTSATQQTISCDSGYSMPNMVINGTGSNYAITSNLTMNTSSTFTLTKGALHTDGTSDTAALTHSWGMFNFANSNTKTLNLGASNITIKNGGNAWAGSASSTTFTAGTSTITLSGAGATFSPGVLTYNNVSLTGSGVMSLGNTKGTFANLTRTGTAVKTDGLTLQSDQVVTGILTLAGQSAINRLFVTSDTVATQRTITTTGATMTWSYLDLQDIKISTTFDASGITGNSGDCGGNTNVTFTAPTTQTWNGTSGGNWSANAWTTHVPLPQDTAQVNAAFSASQTVTMDMPRSGSVDFTGATGTPTFAINSSYALFGSMTWITGMTISGGGATTFSGRGNYTLTSASKTWPNAAFTINCPGGTYTQQDDIICNQPLSLTRGGYNANNNNAKFDSISSNNSNTRSLTMGNGTWNLTSTGVATIVNLATTTGLTFSGASATIVVLNATGNTRTFSGGGLTFGTLTYTVAGSTGQLNMVGSNTFTTINFSDSSNARSLLFTAGTTTTVGTFNVNGVSGKLITIDSITAATHTLHSSNLQSCNYLNVNHSIVDSSPPWYANRTSTDGGTNTNWLFVTYTTSILTDSISLTETLIKSVGKTLTESALTLTESLVRATTKTVTESALTLTENLKRAVSKTLIESITLTEFFSYIYTAFSRNFVVNLTDSITLTEFFAYFTNTWFHYKTANWFTNITSSWFGNKSNNWSSNKTGNWFSNLIKNWYTNND